MPMHQELDMEQKTGIMIRSMTGDIRETMMRKIYKLYGLDFDIETDNEGKNNTDNDKKKEISRSCAEWHCNIIFYFRDLNKAMKYISAIQYAYRNNIDLNKNELWLQLMRLVLPIEFIKKTRIFTQVPQLALMDETKMYKNEPERKALFTEIKW